MLYTTKEIAEMYGGEKKNVTPYMITHTWIPNGLKYARGKRRCYLFKKEWIEEYLESSKTKVKSKSVIKAKRLVNTSNCFVH